MLKVNLRLLSLRSSKTETLMLKVNLRLMPLWSSNRKTLMIKVNLRKRQSMSKQRRRGKCFNLAAIARRRRWKWELMSITLYPTRRSRSLKRGYEFILTYIVLMVSLALAYVLKVPNRTITLSVGSSHDGMMLRDDCSYPPLRLVQLE